MYEITFNRKMLVFGQPVFVTEKQTLPVAYQEGECLDDGRTVVAVKKIVVRRSKSVEVNRPDDLKYLRMAFDRAWGRIKWKLVCEDELEVLFEKLKEDAVLKSMGCRTAPASERWTTFKNRLRIRTLGDQGVTKKLKALEEKPMIKTYFLNQKIR